MNFQTRKIFTNIPKDIYHIYNICKDIHTKIYIYKFYKCKTTCFYKICPILKNHTVNKTSKTLSTITTTTKKNLVRFTPLNNLDERKIKIDQCSHNRTEGSITKYISTNRDSQCAIKAFRLAHSRFYSSVGALSWAISSDNSVNPLGSRILGQNRGGNWLGFAHTSLLDDGPHYVYQNLVMCTDSVYSVSVYKHMYVWRVNFNSSG